MASIGIYDRPALLEALYEDLLREAAYRIELTEPEAKLILDACNGLHLVGELIGQHLRAEIQDGIRLNDLDRKWGVDGDSLVRRLRELPRPMTAAVEIWAADFWSSDWLNDEPKERAHYAKLTEPRRR